jgi:hypothetical protein
MDLVMDEFADKEKLVAKTLVIDDDLEDDAE